MRPQAAKEEITKTQIDSAATKRPAGIAMATVPGMAPKTWFIGQTTPDTYTQNGLVETWRSVKPGDKSPWDERIAKCTMEEHRRGKERGSWDTKRTEEHGRGKERIALLALIDV